jgi:putative chitinase
MPGAFGRDVPLDAIMRFPIGQASPLGHGEDRPFRLTPMLLRRIFPATTQAAADKFADPLTTFMARYEIDTVKRMAAFFGQIAVESSQLQVVEENLTYTSEDRLREVFGSKLPKGSLEDFTRAPEKLGNRVYANVGGNGNEVSGDGYRYRGRGLIQLTLKDNYKAFAAHSRVDVVAEPDLVAKPTYAVWSACWYWDSRRLNGLADTRQIRRLTLKINAAALELPARESATERAEQMLRIELGVTR